MATKNYYSVGGKILGHKAQGQARVDYLTDALGSVTATVDQSAASQGTMRYKPYGSELASMGTPINKVFSWVGSYGYRQADLKYSSIYVRTRHFDNHTGRWTTVDLFWQKQGMYTYSLSQPTQSIDPSGLLVIDSSCNKDPFNRSKILAAFQEACSTISSKPKCGNCCGGWPNIRKCLQEKCASANFKITCVSDAICDNPDKQVGCGRHDPNDPHCGCSHKSGSTIRLCPSGMNPSTCNCIADTILHEMTHTCGEPDEQVPVCVGLNCACKDPIVIHPILQ